MYDSVSRLAEALGGDDSRVCAQLKRRAYGLLLDLDEQQQVRMMSPACHLGPQVVAPRWSTAACATSRLVKGVRVGSLALMHTRPDIHTPRARAPRCLNHSETGSLPTS